MKQIYLKMLWGAFKLQSGLLVAVLISDLALAQYPSGQGRQVGEPVRSTVQRDVEIPFKFWEGGGRRGTALCPNTHPYLLNQHFQFIGPGGQAVPGIAVPRGVQIETASHVKWGVEIEQGNTPVGSRATGATFHASHNDPFAFTGSERFTMVINCTSDPNESYSGPG